ncbi:MAG: recombinase family protein [Planctomycetaceae bacterium]|nr:recombinase family protein [Planctomycetaceae bacterium]
MSDSALSVRAALYARVSSEQQAQEETIASQVAALRERIAADGLTVEEELCFLDEGYSGSTLVRPALERLRDLAAAGAFARVYVHSPDRLARKYAYQVVLVEELRREQVEIVFLNRAIGVSPEEDLLLQMQGMFAEYERAKILERSRRGRRHAAQRGAVSVLSGAPYGYRYFPKTRESEARYEVVPDQARVMEQVFGWVGREHLSLGEVSRRLGAEDIPSPQGKPRWNRATLWNLLKNPAFCGSAAFGKTETVPRIPPLRPARGRPLVPRHTTAKRAAITHEPISIPVPAIISRELYAAVQEQLQENRQRRLGQTRRRYLLQGLLACGCCGYAMTGRQTSQYIYYRCLGNDASRWGGRQLCTNRMVRTDCLDEAVWNDVVTLLQNPRLLADELARRHTQPDAAPQRAQLARQVQQAQRAISRLIDAYQDGLLDKHEWEPRLTQARARLERLQAEEQRLADREAEEAALDDTLASLEHFAADIRRGLDQANWDTRRQILRTLIQRIQIETDQVRITYRIRLPLLLANNEFCTFVAGVISPLVSTRASDSRGKIRGDEVRRLTRFAKTCQPCANAECVWSCGKKPERKGRKRCQPDQRSSDCQCGWLASVAGVPSLSRSAQDPRWDKRDACPTQGARLVGVQAAAVQEPPVEQGLQYSHPRAEVLHRQERNPRFNDRLFGDAPQQDGRRAAAAARAHDNQIGLVALGDAKDGVGDIGPLFKERRHGHALHVDGRDERVVRLALLAAQHLVVFLVGGNRLVEIDVQGRACCSAGPRQRNRDPQRIGRVLREIDRDQDVPQPGWRVFGNHQDRARRFHGQTPGQRPPPAMPGAVAYDQQIGLRLGDQRQKLVG